MNSQDKSTGEKVAIKLLRRPLSPSESEAALLETRIQAIMGKGCVNIVPAREAIMTPSHVGIVMQVDRCDAGR